MNKLTPLGIKIISAIRKQVNEDGTPKSLGDFANEIGITSSYLSRITRGLHSNAPIVNEIAKKLNIEQ